MSLTWLQELRKHTVLVIAIAVHLLSVGGLVYANQNHKQAAVPIAVPAESDFPVPTVSGIPVEIKIPKAGISLKVEPGVYEKATDSWTLSGYNAHFATVTRPANNGGGNTFIYGHNNRHVFGPIKSITPGSEAEVITDTGSRFYYSLAESKVVPPSDVSIFTYTGTPILTIQTCTGVWHEQRELYTFKLERVEESQRSVILRTEAQRKELLETVSTVLNPVFQLTAPRPVQPAEAEAVVVSRQSSEYRQSSGYVEKLSSLVNIEKPLFSKLN